MTSYLIDRTMLTSADSPKAETTHYAGKGGTADNTFEVVIDNSKLLINCFEESPSGPIVIDVLMTEGYFVQYNDDGSTTSEIRDVSGGSTWRRVIHPNPVYDHSDNTYLYPTKWDGHDASGLDFVPVTPDGYDLSSMRYVMVGSITSGTPTTISESTSGWGYIPEPVKSPFMICGFGSDFVSTKLILGDIPVGVAVELLSSNILTLNPDNADFQSPWHTVTWLPSGSPTNPYDSDPVVVTATKMAIRFTYDPI